MYTWYYTNRTLVKNIRLWTNENDCRISGDSFLRFLLHAQLRSKAPYLPTVLLFVPFYQYAVKLARFVADVSALHSIISKVGLQRLTSGKNAAALKIPT